MADPVAVCKRCGKTIYLRTVATSGTTGEPVKQWVTRRGSKHPRHCERELRTSAQVTYHEPEVTP